MPEGTKKELSRKEFGSLCTHALSDAESGITTGTSSLSGGAAASVPGESVLVGEGAEVIQSDAAAQQYSGWSAWCNVL